MKKLLNPPAETNDRPVRKGSFTRRHFIRTAAGTAGALTFGMGGLTGAQAARKRPKPPRPPSGPSQIEHVVVVMMENRSFDHFLGWLPGADGRQAGLTYTDENGVAYSTFPLAPDYQGCSHPCPDHSYEGGRVEYNGGACDGWLRAGDNDEYAIGYYTQNDLAFLGAAAPQWTTCDQYFSAIMASTYPNKIYQHAAQTDRIDNSTDISTLPTIWDRLSAHSLRGRYYFSDVPFIALWGSKYLPITRHVTQFFADCAQGNLPEVSFVDPRFLGAELGLSGDDHPHADIRNGEVFLNLIYNAVISSPNWRNTVLVINYDEWGGFFDHVPPMAAPIPEADRAAGNQDGLRGFRVPCCVISPWSRRGTVAHGLYDHTSVLRMIEDRWQLEPLSVRDANANSLADVLDFSSPNLAAPRYDVPLQAYGTLCPLTTDLTLDTLLGDEWKDLVGMARDLGFFRFF